MAGYFPKRFSSQVVDKLLIVVYPVPYYILALVLLMIFTYYWPIFPLVGGARGPAAWSWKYISSLLHHSFLPALSIVIGATAFRFIMAKALTSSEKSSDYVRYAEMAAVPKDKILLFYVIRNTMLPQVTDLGLSLGTIFEVRSSPKSCMAIRAWEVCSTTASSRRLQRDYGITLLSIVGIATASLLVDLSYPLFDPRVRYR